MIELFTRTESNAFQLASRLELWSYDEELVVLGSETTPPRGRSQFHSILSLEEMPWDSNRASSYPQSQCAKLDTLAVYRQLRILSCVSEIVCPQTHPSSRPSVQAPALFACSLRARPFVHLSNRTMVCSLARPSVCPASLWAVRLRNGSFVQTSPAQSFWMLQYI